MHQETKKSCTHFIVIFTLLLWSATEPAMLLSVPGPLFPVDTKSMNPSGASQVAQW